MKGILLTSIGIEDAAADELEEYGASNIEAKRGAVIFEVDDQDDLARIAYISQSAERILFHLGHLTFKDIEEDLQRHVEFFDDFRDFVFEGMSFRATCVRKGEHNFSSPQLEGWIGDALSDAIESRYKISAKVNLETPDVIFFASVVDNSLFLGIDFTGFDSSKRDYKIFLTPVSIKGTIGYGLLRYANYEKKHALIDPFINDGAIIIEAALFSSGKPVHYYRKDKLAFLRLLPFREKDTAPLFEAVDKKIKTKKLPVSGFDAAFQYVDYGKKNAKIAGVEKMIYLSRVESEWLDIKFEKKSVDRIITKIPEPSRKLISKDVKKLHGELFYQAEYILKDTGKVGIICRELSSLEPHYSKHGFVIEKQKDVFTGEQKMVMAVLVKGKEKYLKTASKKSQS